jgi:hypothetical protein
MPISNTVKPAIVALVEAGRDEFLSKIRCGFELETNSLFGEDISSVGEDNLRNSAEEELNLPPQVADKLEVGFDSSVRGLEFRTVGGLTVDEFDTLLRKVTDLDFEVTTGCSFHIHLSVSGIRHKYSGRMARRLYLNLAKRKEEFPTCVQDRLASDATRFCQSIDSELHRNAKMSAVHFHPRFKTWEFRLFGNVDNYTDGMTCLNLAIDALWKAYSDQVAGLRRAEIPESVAV